MQPLTPEVYVPRHLSLRTDKAYTRWLRGNAAGGFGRGRVDGWEVSQQCLWTTHESNWKEVHAVESTFKLVFYSKIAPWLENLQQQAIFDGAFFQTSKCSDKF
jgi:hypothetical protein